MYDNTVSQDGVSYGVRADYELTRTIARSLELFRLPDIEDSGIDLSRPASVFDMYEDENVNIWSQIAPAAYGRGCSLALRVDGGFDGNAWNGATMLSVEAAHGDTDVDMRGIWHAMQAAYESVVTR